MASEPMGPKLGGMTPPGDLAWLAGLPWWRDWKTTDHEEDWCPIPPAQLNPQRMGSLAFGFGLHPGRGEVTFGGWVYWITVAGRLRRRRA